mgnify:CR=1 FL=1
MYDNMRCDQIEPLKWRVSCEVTGTPFYLIGNLVYTTLMIITFILFGKHDEKL